MRKTKKKNTKLYATIVAYPEFLDLRPGDMVTLTKDPSNPVDDEAIMVTKAGIEKHGFIANSVDTVVRGTYSAGRLYDKIGDTAVAKVKHVVNTPNLKVSQFAVIKIIGYFA